MSSGAKLLVLLLCAVAIGGLFLPQIKGTSTYSESETTLTYLRFGEEYKEKENGLGITILVLIGLAVLLLLVNANVISLLALTAAGTLVVYNGIAIIKLMNQYKEYSGVLSGVIEYHYGIGFYMLPAGILLSAIIVLFNLNTQSDSYSSGISYSSLKSRTVYQPNSYNSQSYQAIQPQPAMQPSYNQPYGQASYNNGYQSTGMQNSVVNTNIFNQAPVASNISNFDSAGDNDIQTTSIGTNTVNCPCCASPLNNGMQFCNNCGSRIN